VFLGHFAVALAAKRAVPKTSLGTLTAAAQFLDLLWPVLVLLGIERFHVVPGLTQFSPFAFDSYPWSHSLLMALVWSAIFAGLYRARTGYARGALKARYWKP
jgi:hypothetical protein